MWSFRLAATLAFMTGCATPPATAPPVQTPREAAALTSAPGEVRLRNLRQLTFGGENAEAYWSFDGRRLVFQARHEGEGCDRIYQMDALAARSAPELVSSGKGARACAFFLPGDEEGIYASTHAGGDECPPRPDMSQG